MQKVLLIYRFFGSEMLLNSLHTYIFLPFIFAIFIPFIYKYTKEKIHTGWFILPIPVVIFIYFLYQIPYISKGNVLSSSISWIPSLNINFSLFLDGLGLLFVLLISGIGTLVVIYSIFYLSKEKEELHKFYIYLLLFMGAMLGLVLSENIFILYSLWELTSVSSFLLIAFWYERKKSREGALKAMLITVFGGLAMLAGLIMLSLITNSYNIREMIENASIIQESSLFIPAMILILLGAFTKSAQFPFSIWLPDAMEAPTPVSAYLHSATMVKAGIFLVARMTPIFAGNGYWFWLITGTGLITLIYGSIRAVRQTDLKAMLAYSTVSQLGLIMSLLGIGSAAFLFETGNEQFIFLMVIFAAVFHLFNHSTFKGSLFMVVGIIDHETGTRDLRRLGGLMSVMPITFTIALIGSFSMAGLPPFNGFLSKEMFFTGVLNASELNVFGVDSIGWIIPLIAWVASVFTFIYSMILLVKPFRGRLNLEKLPKNKVHEATVGMLISPVLLGSLVVIVFFFPNVIGKYILTPAVAGIMPNIPFETINIPISAWHGWNTELFMTIGVVVLGTILLFLVKKWYSGFRLIPEKLTLNYLYKTGIEKMESGSVNLTNKYMTGSIRHYIMYILVFLLFTLGGYFILHGKLNIDVSNNGFISIYDVGVVIAMLVAALVVMFTNNRMTAIIALGSVGYLVVMMFVILRAPDLALTQMVVETASTVLFLLCFYHFPKLGKKMTKMKFNLTNLIISISVGLLVTVLTLEATGHKLFKSISYFYENSYEFAGAKNIVNAILVDFRGFDTMLEITVLMIAGLGVYTLVKLRLKGRDSDETK